MTNFNKNKFFVKLHVKSSIENLALQKIEEKQMERKDEKY